MTFLRCLLVPLLTLPVAAQSSGPPTGRSEARAPVISKQGIAASNQVIASQIGAQILARGGSAVDAAIAMNAALGVLEPMMAGLGGDLFVFDHREFASYPQLSFFCVLFRGISTQPSDVSGCVDTCTSLGADGGEVSIRPKFWTRFRA